MATIHTNFICQKCGTPKVMGCLFHNWFWYCPKCQQQFQTNCFATSNSKDERKELTDKEKLSKQISVNTAWFCEKCGNIKQINSYGIMYCPKCESTDIYYTDNSGV